MNTEIIITKFGGTSVGCTENMRRVAEIIGEVKPRIVVLSAMSGTTDTLTRVAAAAQRDDHTTAIELAEELQNAYVQNAVQLITAAPERTRALQTIVESFARIRVEIDRYDEHHSAEVIVAQGEIMTSHLFAAYLSERHLRVKYLHAPDFLHVDAEKQPNIADLTQRISPLLEEASDTVYVTQGFICTSADGHLATLGRGGSDYSAALIGAALNANQIQIWTDIDGMHNGDPRYVSPTHPIAQLSFDEAAELAYFGAKILHPSTLIPCAERSIPVVLKNTLNPNAPGTLITRHPENGERFTAVAAKDDITVIRIHSSHMLMSYGFLRRVFEVFEHYRTPIDMIATSEVSVALTVDDDSHIFEITEALGSYGCVEVSYHRTIVCVVGMMNGNAVGTGAEILAAVRPVPVEMVSYGASCHNFSFLVETRHKIEVLNQLNQTLFNTTRV